jgi:DNA-binding HxlR family transcriptional regulator
MQTQIEVMTAPGSRAAAAETARNADRMLHLVGQKWLLFVLRNVCEGQTRFNQIQASLGISRALLTDRLRMLVAEGLIETTALPGNKSRLQYVPTANGLTLYRIIVKIQVWGERL